MSSAPNRFAIMTDVITALRHALDSDKVTSVDSGRVEDDAGILRRKIECKTSVGNFVIYMDADAAQREAMDAIGRVADERAAKYRADGDGYEQEQAQRSDAESSDVN